MEHGRKNMGYPAALGARMELGFRWSGSLASSLSFFPRRPKVVSTKLKHCCCYSTISLSELLDREWMLPSPDTQIHKISLSGMALPLHAGAERSRLSFSNDILLAPGTGMIQKGEEGLSFYVVRDDLLHPLVNGNKARKLDALLPILQQHAVTDVVTCGGCQSAHTAAVAVSCAERGIRPHLLLRGEQPEVPTGYNLVSLMYGNTTYVARSLYAKREEILLRHANLVAGSHGDVVLVDDILDKTTNCQKPFKTNTGSLDGDGTLSLAKAEQGSRKVVIVNEGAGNVVALLGVIRLVRYLSQAHLLGIEQEVELVLDAGTGTTAIALALGAMCLGLPWKITAVMLADTFESYRKREDSLISDFKRVYWLEYPKQELHGVDNSIVNWVERIHPRKFGKVLKGEIEMCQKIAQQTGVLVDPVYTLAAWEQAILSVGEARNYAKVVMLHTGGTLGIFGLAQRYASHFHGAEPAHVHIM